MRFFATFQAIAEDAVLDIAFERELVIKNKRLGILHKILTFFALVAVATYLISEQVWYGRYYGQNMGVIVWPSAATDLTALFNTSVMHCQNFPAYRYEYSESYVYNPTTCKVLALGKQFMKMGTRIFVPTFVSDSHMRRAVGQDACATLEQNCPAPRVFDSAAESLYGLAMGRQGSRRDLNNRSLDALITSQECSCSWGEQYFTRNPEEMSITFLHGFQVPLSSDRRYVMRGIAAAGTIEEGLYYDAESSPGSVLTILRKSDGSRCVVNGRSEFMPHEVGTGITGTIREWVACAGVNLDSNPNQILQDENMPPNIRTMGATITFNMEWTNRWRGNNYDDSVKVICYVTVGVRPAWNTMVMRDTGQAPGTDTEDMTVLARNAGGIEVEFQDGGVFYFFRFERIITAFVSAIVILQVPVAIMKFIILYSMGVVSTIYRNAQRKPLKIYSNFHGVVARMFVTAAMFRGLLLRKDPRHDTIFKEPVKDKGLTRKDLSFHLTDVLRHWVLTEDLSTKEMATLVDVVLDGLDAGHNNEVNLNEYVHACTSTDTMTMSDMTEFFKGSRKRGICEKFFDKSHRKKKMAKEAHAGDSDTAGGFLVGGALGGALGAALEDFQDTMAEVANDISDKLDVDADEGNDKED